MTMEVVRKGGLLTSLAVANRIQAIEEEKKKEEETKKVKKRKKEEGRRERRERAG